MLPIKEGRKWLPQDWLDECTPEMRENPNDFIWRSPAGGHWLMPTEGQLAQTKGSTDWQDHARALEHMETLTFGYQDPLPSIRITVQPDGELYPSTIAWSAPDEGSVVYWNEESEEQGDTPAEVIKFMRDGGTLPEPGGEFVIHGAWWRTIELQVTERGRLTSLPVELIEMDLSVVEEIMLSLKEATECMQYHNLNESRQRAAIDQLGRYMKHGTRSRCDEGTLVDRFTGHHDENK